MCDYLERMKKTNVPTEEIRLWSSLAHRVAEYTGPFPTPEDRIITLWLHEESATMLLDMCDDIDKKFNELETENAKLKERVEWLDGECRKRIGESHKFFEMVGEYQKANDKLRECLQDFADAIKNDDGFGVDQGWMLERMHELGIRGR